ncbi:siderophore-interacting protein [Chitinophaga nivalis]|uniref:Siderophore-interacting protein n=1 Tax=Chitinophaga nivalis TaxID=2991709 RepID=A0ABT3IEE4_9BACT|nr:siderophore-interacting protein [Chitinophaga nivalis]MCW3467973.1 siderophore-interacting protein [Chitinophaga nivalis]MCW3482336.1 siderophore-interacting protein [Chitinophaga nivalis]
MPSIKDRATSLLMSTIGKTASVTRVQFINNELLQADLQLTQPLPDRSTQHLKCEVAPYTYRDYTVASWNAVTQTATLLINCRHDGPGSRWAQQLRSGTTVSYAGPGGGLHQPTKAACLVCIGDASAAGHFHSLYIRRNHEQQFHTFLQLEDHTIRQLLQMPVQPLSNNGYFTTDLHEWLYHYNFPADNTTYYVAGNSRMVVQIRKSLRQQGGQVKAQGFWD